MRRPQLRGTALVTGLALVLLVTPLVVGWLTTTKPATTVAVAVAVVGTREEVDDATIEELVGRETDFAGPIVAVVEPPCPQTPTICPAPSYHVLGAKSIGPMDITQRGEHAYYVTTTRHEFGMASALISVVLLVVLLAVGTLVTGVVMAGRSPASPVPQVTPRRGHPTGMPMPNGPAAHRHDGRAAMRGLDAGPRITGDRTRPDDRTPQPEDTVRRTANPAPRAPAVAPPKSVGPTPVASATAIQASPGSQPRRSVRVHPNPSSDPEVLARIWAGHGRGVARTHIDATGGYAEFDELILWVDNAEPGGTPGDPGDSVQLIPVPRKEFERNENMS